MNVFVSWSGELSKNIALLIKEWITTCIQSTDVFMSNTDIDKGDDWNSKIRDSLSKSNFGIVCLTKENASAPWIHFESGALAKHLTGKVATILIDLEISEIVGALKGFQSTRFTEHDMKQLITTINQSQDKPVVKEVLERTFDLTWEKLKNDIESQIKEKPTKKGNTSHTSNKNDAIEEILQLTRRIHTENSMQNDKLFNTLSKMVFDKKNSNIWHDVSLIQNLMENIVRLLPANKENMYINNICITILEIILDSYSNQLSVKDYSDIRRWMRNITQEHKNYIELRPEVRLSRPKQKIKL